MEGYTIWRVSCYHFDYDEVRHEMKPVSDFRMFHGVEIANKVYDEFINNMNSCYQKMYGFLVILESKTIPVEGSYELYLDDGWWHNKHYFHESEDAYIQNKWEIMMSELLPQSYGV